jgi:hypothetical protein
MSHHLCAILVTLFGWPGGILLGNLLANMAWVPLQWLGIHLRIKSAHSGLHARLDGLEALLGDCPACGHRRSAADLQTAHDGS